MNNELLPKNLIDWSPTNIDEEEADKMISRRNTIEETLKFYK